jgi:hypothetical protein
MRIFLLPCVLSLLLLTGCGDEEAVKPRDPTLKGLVQRLRASGLKIGEKIRLSLKQDQAARIGRAAGLANELAGAGLSQRFPTETESRRIEAYTVLLERYATAIMAAESHAERQSLEARQKNPGCVVFLLHGDKLLTVRGTGMVGNARPFPGTPPPRPATPPDPAFVDQLQQALEAAETP